MKRRCIWVASVAVLGLVAGCGGAQSRLESHLNRGKEYFDSGDYGKAGVEFRNALQVQPKNPEALFFAGRVAEQRGDFRNAAGLYTAAVDGKPDYELARANLARIYVFGGDPVKARELTDAGLKLNPKSADLLAVRAAARKELKDDTGALADTEQALQIDPLNENAVALMAGFKSDTGDTNAAIAVVSTAVEALPKSTNLRELLANLYVTAGQPQKVEEQMRKLIELQPKFFRPRFQLALYFTQIKRLDEAQKTLEDAVAALPKDNGAKLALVDFLVAQRSNADGQKTLRFYIQRDPDNYDLRFGLAHILQESKDQKAAQVVLQEIILRDGIHTNGLLARDHIAEMDVDAGDYAGAQKLVDEVLQTNPRDTDALAARANIALHGNDPASAIRDLRAVLRDQPNSIALYRLLARAYVANGQAELAGDAFRHAMDLAPNDVDSRLDYAKFLMQVQRQDEAVALVEKTVHDAPTEWKPREALIQAYLAANNLSSARKAADDFQTLQPQSPTAAYLQWLIAQRQNRLEYSENQLQRALTLRPGAIDTLAALSTVQLQRGEAAAAVSGLESAIAAEPSNAALHNLLGEVLIATRAYSEAGEQLTKAIELAPKWWVPYRGLTGVKLALSDTPGAIAVCEDGLEKIPYDTSLTQQLAGLYERQSRADDAIKLYEGLLAHNPQLDVAANNLALLLVAYRHDPKDLERARQITERFSSSQNGLLLDTHGWVRYQSGDFVDALSSLERAADRSPDSKLIRYHLAMAQLESGQRDRAVRNLETAVAGSVQYAGVEQARAKLAELKHSTG